MGLDLDQVIGLAMDRLPAGSRTSATTSPEQRPALQFTLQRLQAAKSLVVNLGVLGLADGDQDYDLPSDEHDVLRATIRDTNQTVPTDIPLGRMSRDEWHYTPDKSTPASRPASTCNTVACCARCLLLAEAEQGNVPGPLPARLFCFGTQDPWWKKARPRGCRCS